MGIVYRTPCDIHFVISSSTSWVGSILLRKASGKKMKGFQLKRLL